jgi:hypothetical protein
MDGYEIRALQPGDEHSLLETFNLVFAAYDPQYRPRALEEWRWAFERNPAGQRVFVALHRGEVIAQYAALPVRMWIDGEQRSFAQIVDSLVHPAHRARTDRPSLFLETARAFFAHFGGPQKDWVHFGWPNARVLKLGERELGYATLRTQLALVKELGAAKPSARADGAEVLESFDQQAKWLWDRCADSQRASAIRDAAYWNWRFVAHPRERYTMHGVRDVGAVLRGVCIARKAKFAGVEPWCVADWCVPPNEPQVAEALLAATVQSARAQGARQIALIVPEWSPWSVWFQEHGFLAHPTAYRTIARPFQPRLHHTWLRSNWYYQLGDSDLV